MAQSVHRLNIKDALFPMLSEKQTRTTIGSRAEPAGESTPSIAYCHNVVPTEEGYNSVGFISSIAATALLPDGLSMSDVRVIYGDVRSRIYIAWDTDGNVYSLLPGSTAWIALPATVPATTSTVTTDFSTESVTIGTVNGISHIFYSGIGSFTYNEATNALDAETLTGLNIATILGVVASSGYLVAYTDGAIAWSSTLDPTDFVPSTVTGAGGGNVAGIEGAILFITSNTLGLLVYTAANTVAGTYTGNTQFPFKFKPVKNSKGGLGLDLTAYEANSAKQYVYSKAGLQTITSQGAELILPEVTDFLAGKRFEDYNELTKLYELTDLTSTLLKKVKFIASRYVIVSYGITSFTHAIIFDIGLERVGKLKIDHTDVFDYIDSQEEIAKESVAFLLPTGEVKLLDFSIPGASSGVLILGKVELVHTRFLTLHEVEVENVESSSILTVDSQASLTGKAFTTVNSTLETQVAGTQERKYVFKPSSAKNHSIVFIGEFNLVTALVRYSIGARR